MSQIKYLAIIFCCIIISNINAQDFWQSTGGTSTSLAIRPIVTNANGDIFLGTGGGSSGTEGNGIIRSIDHGNNWTQSGLSNLFIWDIVIDTSGNIFAGTQLEGVWRSTDNGVSWAQINAGISTIDKNVYSLAINSLGEIYAGTVNSIYVSANSGDTWTPINSPNYNGFYPLDINSNDDLFTGTAGGRLFRSTDSGLSWTEITIAIAQIGAITFNELGHVFVGNLMGIYRSTDNGDNWDQINNGINVGNYIAVNAFTINSAKIIYVGLGGGFGSTSKGVFYSTNNGDYWNELNDGLTNNALMSLTVDPDDYLYAGNTQGQVYKSIDPSTANILNKKLANLNIPLSNTQPAVSTINFSPPQGSNKTSSIQSLGSVQLAIDEVMHQRTGDLTFTLEHLGVNQTIIFEAGVDGQNFLNTILGDDNSIPISNGTAPFTGYYIPSAPLSVFNGMEPYGDWTLTITDGNAGNDGVLNSWSLIITLDAPTDVKSENELLPDEFVLHQNYPNPFNPSTKIRFSIPNVTLRGVEGSRVQLKIYDILGNEVAALVDEFLPTGSYEVEFNAEGLSSGIYFYSIKAEEYFETKKMILLR